MRKRRYALLWIPTPHCRACTIRAVFTIAVWHNMNAGRARFEGLAVGGRRERANDRVRVKLERIAAARKKSWRDQAATGAGRLVPLQ